MSGASFHRGESRGDFETPSDLLCAVEGRWGPLEMDLAATAETAKAPNFITLEQDSLLPLTIWPRDAVCWLNPPFGHIEPWAAKCARQCERLESEGRIILLVPASVGANWYRDHVHGKARVYFLNGRIKFVGAVDWYQRDCLLAVYGEKPGYEVWSWR